MIASPLNEAYLSEYLHHSFQIDTGHGFENWLQQFEHAREQRLFEHCQTLLGQIKTWVLPDWELGKVYQCQGLLALDQTAHEVATRFFQRSLAQYRKIGNKRSEAQLLGNLGVLYNHEGKWEKAIECYLFQLPIYQELHLYRSYAETLMHLASTYEKQGQLDAAEENHRLSLELFSKVGTEYDRAMVLENLGIVYSSRAKREESLACHQQAYTIFQQLGERYQSELSLNNIGVIYRQLQRWQEAIEAFQQSLEIKQELKDVRGIGATLNNLGMVYLSLGELTLADTKFNEAGTIFEEVGDSYAQALALCNQCKIGLTIQQWDTFEQYSLKALQLSQTRQYIDLLAELERMCGEKALKQQQYVASLHHFEQATAFAIQHNPEFLERTLAHTQLALVDAIEDTVSWIPEFLQPLIIFWEKWQLNQEYGKFFHKILTTLSE